MKIGGHVSTAGGIQNAPERAAAIGGNCAQIFISAPQGWRTFDITDDQVGAFKQNIEKFGIDPIFIHALYLLNLATDDRELEGKSEDALVYALTECARIGCAGVIFHIGSRKEQEQSVAIDAVVKRIKRILDQTPESSYLLIENSAGESDGRKMGGSFEEIGQIIKAVNSDRLKVCLDTEHAFAEKHQFDERKRANTRVRQRAGFVKLHAFGDKVGARELAEFRGDYFRVCFRNHLICPKYEAAQNGVKHGGAVALSAVVVRTKGDRSVRTKGE